MITRQDQHALDTEDSITKVLRAAEYRLRKKQAWPQDKPFRILSIDGGGIRGIYPAAVLSKMEEKLPRGKSLADCFDLIAGTSTGGILALGLSAGVPAKDLLELYMSRGGEIFPSWGDGWLGRIGKKYRKARQIFLHSYDSDVLAGLLRERFGKTTLGDVKSRLCIPSFDGKHGEVYVFKTPHHPDYKLDIKESLVDVALANKPFEVV